MKNVHVKRYSGVNKQLWDDFVSQAEVHSILFYRDFMEYHSDRFADYSLMVFQENKLIAILPANIDADNILHSHQGLSYGGFLFQRFARLEVRVAVYDSVLRFLEKNSVVDMMIKSIPSFYLSDHVEQLVLHWLNAKKERTYVYTYFLREGYKVANKGRLEGIKNGKQLGVDIRQSTDFKAFWNDILVPNLGVRFGVKPTHEVDEIVLLSQKFQNQIQLFCAFQGQKLRAGIVVFIHKNVAHAQYIAGDNNRKDGALDLLIDDVIRKFNNDRIFSFGTSSENQGDSVNKGLLYWKESFRAVNDVQQFYHIKTANHTKLINRI